MKPMKRSVDVRERIPGLAWRAGAILQLHPGDIVRPALEELRVEFEGGTTISRHVDLELGALERQHQGEVNRLPISWRSTKHAGLFPTFEGELRVDQHGSGDIELRLLGEYEPPLGRIGALGDRVAGHRMAEQSLRDFLRGVGERLRTRIVEHGESAHWRSPGIPGGPSPDRP